MAKEESATAGSNENSSIWKIKSVFIAGLAICLLLSYYLIFQVHILEDPVFHYSSEAGNLDYTFNVESSGIKNDYVMFVNYESKGAFMGGREIRVSIDLWAVNNIDRLRNSQLVVVFPGALNVPIPDNTQWSDASIELKFINESSTHALGKGKIIYYMPEYNESVIVFKSGGTMYQILPAISNEPKYTYYLIIEGNIQKPENVIIKNRFLSIAPLETYLQLKINNWIIFLTIIAAFLALTEIVYKREK